MAVGMADSKEDDALLSMGLLKAARTRSPKPDSVNPADAQKALLTRTLLFHINSRSIILDLINYYRPVMLSLSTIQRELRRK